MRAVSDTSLSRSGSRRTAIEIRPARRARLHHAPLLRGHDDGAAGSPAAAPVGVRNGRIEIQGVARFERMLLAAHVHAQRALDRVDELDARMIVLARAR